MTSFKTAIPLACAFLFGTVAHADGHKTVDLDMAALCLADNSESLTRSRTSKKELYDKCGLTDISRGDRDEALVRMIRILDNRRKGHIYI